MVVVYSQMHTKHTNTRCGKNIALLNVKSAGAYGTQWALKCFNTYRNITWVFKFLTKFK